MADQVNHPAHYQCGGIETIDVIRAKLGDGFGYYCEGNAIKYLTRWRLKGGVQDLRKARVYLDWLIELEEKALLGDLAAEAQARGMYEEADVQHHAKEAPMPPHDSIIGQAMAAAQFEAACSGPALNHAGGDIAE